MTALAILAQEMGKTVIGSDVAGAYPTENILNKYKIKCQAGFLSRNIQPDTDLVVYTGAHQGSHNIEVLTALKKGIPAVSHGEALGMFMKGKYGISVAGSHGKTTTSAMIAHILYKANLNPSFAIGCGEITGLGTPAHFGKGKYFVAEADEYVTDPTADNKPRFLWQYPEILVITNIDFDHPDVYADITQIQEAFIKLTNNVKPAGFVVYNIDNPETRQILPKIKRKAVTFGTTKKADYYLKNVGCNNSQTVFTICNHGRELGNFSIRIPGFHNALNATAAVACLKSIGISTDDIMSGLSSFSGTKRRFELIGEKNTKILYDDYAHHPAEIAATLEAAKLYYPYKKITVIFQPHTFSRTLSLLHQFGTSFMNADKVVICDIYASAREQLSKDISGKLLCREVLKHQKDVYYAPKLSDVLEYLKAYSEAGDLIITMGAGDIYSWIGDIFKIL